MALPSAAGAARFAFVSGRQNPLEATEADGYRAVVPIFYECQRCTACCRWPGQVRLTEEELSRLASFLGLDEFAFIQKFTRLAHDRRGLALQEKPDGGCIFLEGQDCAVQPVKPQQCRDFPNLWNFPGFEKVCRARPLPLNDGEYARRMEAATGRKDVHGRTIAAAD